MPNDDIQQLLKLRPNLSAERQKQVDEIVAMYGQQETPFDNLPMGGAIDRFGSRMGQNLEGMYAPLGIGIDETQKELNSGRPVDMTTPLRIGAHGLGRVVHGLAEGVKEQYIRPQTRSINPLVDPGNFGREVLRGATGWVPGVGPQFNDMIDQYQSGDWAGGNADALFGLASIFGPKVMKSLNIPASTIGKKLYDASLTPKSTLPIHDIEGLKNIGWREQVYPTSTGLNDIRNRITPTARTGRDTVLSNAQAQGKTVKMDTVRGDAMDEFYNRLDSVDPNSAEPIFNQLDQVNMRWRDPTIPINIAQDAKTSTSKLIRDSAFNRNSEVVDTGGKVAGYKLLESGLRKGLEEAVPEVTKWNRDLHDASNLRKTIEAQIATGNDYWKGITPYIIPFEIATIAGGAFTGNTGAMAGGIAGLLTTAAMRSPVLKARLAIAMKYAGTGDVSNAVAHLPKISQADLEKELHRQDQ